MQLGEASRAREAERQREVQAEEAKRQAELMSKIVRRMKMAGVLSAFDAWRDNVEERIHVRQVMSKIVRRMTMVGVLWAFAAWRDNVGERIHVRHLLQRVSFRLQNQAAAMAFSTWSEAVAAELARREEEERMQAQQEMHQHVLVQERERLAREAAEREREVAEREREAEAGRRRALEAEEAKRQAELMSKIVRRMKMAGVLSAFDAWWDNVEERNHVRQLMSKIVRRMKMAGVLSAFAAWRDNVEERIRVRQLLQRVSFRMQNQAAAMALRTWAQHRFDSARIRAALSQGSVMRVRRATAEAWYSWVEVVDAELARRREEERARALEQEMLARSLHQDAARLEQERAHAIALELQREKERAMKRESEEEERKRKLMKRIAQRFMNAVLSSSFEHWQQSCAVLAQRRQHSQRLLDANAAASHISHLQDSMDTLMQTLQLSLNTKVAQDIERHGLSRQLAERERDIARLKVEQERYEREYVRRTELRLVQSEATACARDLASALADKDALVVEFEKLQCLRVETQGESDRLRRELQETIAASDAACDAARASEKASHKELKSLQVALEARQDEVKALRAVRDDLQQTLKTANLEHAQHVHRLTEDMAVLKQDLTDVARLAEAKEKELDSMSRQLASLVAAEKRAKEVKELNDKLIASLQRMEERCEREGWGVGSNGDMAGRKSKNCGPGSVMALVAERDHALHRELDTQAALNKARVELAQKDTELTRYPLPYMFPCTVVSLCDVRSADIQPTVRMLTCQYAALLSHGCRLKRMQEQEAQGHEEELERCSMRLHAQKQLALERDHQHECHARREREHSQQLVERLQQDKTTLMLDNRTLQEAQSVLESKLATLTASDVVVRQDLEDKAAQVVALQGTNSEKSYL